MGTADDRITTTVVLDSHEIDIKLCARAAHRTQLNPQMPLNQLPEESLRDWLGTERFVLLYPPGLPGNGAEHDLFAGVRL